MGYSQTLATGTNVGVDFILNRNSSNSAFNTFNPSWSGNLRYSFSQHLLRDFGRLNNTRLIRVAQNNEKISETQFERQLIDLVAQAQRTYWDLVFTAEDVKVKQRSMDLAQKTLSDNEIQVRSERWLRSISFRRNPRSPTGRNSWLYRPIRRPRPEIR